MRFIKVTRELRAMPPVEPEKVQERLEAVFGRKEFEEKTVILGCSSRGIGAMKDGTFLYARLVKAIVAWFQARGANVKLIPAMGSHGGGTPEGQLHVLETYGITADSMGCPIDASMDVVQLATLESGVEVNIARSAYEADYFLAVCRVKDHTELMSSFGSGIQKMFGIGFGKLAGAEKYHIKSLELSGGVANLSTGEALASVLQQAAHKVMKLKNCLGGVAVVENPDHTFAVVEAIAAGRVVEEEPLLLQTARALHPRLPDINIDLLVVQKMGKDMSGSGMDTQVTGRFYRGQRAPTGYPQVNKLAVLGLTQVTKTNALGIGFADATTQRVVSKWKEDDGAVTIKNCVTGGRPELAELPKRIFLNDRTLIETLVREQGRMPRVVIIRSTLDVETILVSEWALQDFFRDVVLTEPVALEFDPDGNLVF